MADPYDEPADETRKTLDSGPRAGIGNDARSNKPIPDKQHKHRADSGSDKSCALISPIPANRLAKPGREEGVFFFSSRRGHTSWPRDWSSDVCSSDLSRG